MDREIQKHTLANGLRIVLEPDEKMRSCSMGVWIHSGSGYERAAVSGISHFMEHMLFRGSETRTAMQIAEEMDAIGGVLNAYTAKEYTCVYARALSDHVELAFDIIADMIVNPRLDEKDIQIEKGIVAEEIAMYEDSPDDLCMDLFYEAVWPDTPYGRNILGTRETVAALTREALQAHLAEYYTAEKMVVSFCGNFDSAMVLELCEKYFGGCRRGTPFLQEETVQYCRTMRLQDKEVEQNQLILGFPGVPTTDRQKYAINLYSAMLGASSSSRLFRRIREELGLAYSIESFHAPYQSAGLFGIAMGVSPDAEVQAIQETLQILAAFGSAVREDELARAKEQAVSGMIMSFESSASRVSHAGRSELLYAKILTEDEMIARIRGVTMEEIRAAAERFADSAQMSICAVGNVRSASSYESLVK